jgi:hypothetical protein
MQRKPGGSRWPLSFGPSLRDQRTEPFAQIVGRRGTGHSFDEPPTSLPVLINGVAGGNGVALPQGTIASIAANGSRPRSRASTSAAPIYRLSGREDNVAGYYAFSFSEETVR